MLFNNGMKNILVPTDFSPEALNALNFAVPLAEKFKASIILFHAYSLPSQSIETPRNILTGEIQVIEKATEKKLLQLVDKVHTENKDIICRYMSRLGSPINGILQIIDEEQIDLAVMGTGGGGMLRQILADSHTAHIAGNAHCPILAVPGKAQYSHFNRIAFATDFSGTDFETINKLTNLVSLYGSELMIIHVSAESSTSDKELLTWFKELAVEKVLYQRLSFQWLEHSDLQKGINVFMLDNDVDLLAMSTRKRTFIERLFNPSQTKKMIYLTKKPLLIFHAEANEKAL